MYSKITEKLTHEFMPCHVPALLTLSWKVDQNIPLKILKIFLLHTRKLQQSKRSLLTAISGS